LSTKEIEMQNVVVFKTKYLERLPPELLDALQRAGQMMQGMALIEEDHDEVALTVFPSDLEWEIVQEALEESQKNPLEEEPGEEDEGSD
jgi:hypothetical protein